MIPKRIHYCWFGKNDMPEMERACIDSWKKYCNEYEIIRWDESNFDISENRYVREAYNARKWAFVSDYVRLWAVLHQGGIYMDTDVEVIKPLDRFLQHRAFSGFESDTSVSTGIMACEKGFPLFTSFLDEYDRAMFVLKNGKYDETTNVVRITKECMERGLIQNNTYQEIDGFALYPSEYFCPMDASGTVNITDNTYTIHHFTASWKTENQRRAFKLYQSTLRKHGNDAANRLWMRMLSRYYRVGIRQMFDFKHDKR